MYVRNYKFIILFYNISVMVHGFSLVCQNLVAVIMPILEVLEAHPWFTSSVVNW